MENNKHTPGTWFVSNFGDNDITITSNDRDTTHVCRINESMASSQFNHVREEAEANGKLIAAAPTMLETIDETANRIAYCIDLYHIPEEAVAMLRGEIDNLNAAINKATK